MANMPWPISCTCIVQQPSHIWMLHFCLPKSFPAMDTYVKKQRGTLYYWGTIKCKTTIPKPHVYNRVKDDILLGVLLLVSLWCGETNFIWVVSWDKNFLWKCQGILGLGEESVLKGQSIEILLIIKQGEKTGCFPVWCRSSVSRRCRAWDRPL